MSKKLDPYAELGVDRDASDDQIKKAFRRKSKKAHPDHGGTADEFVRLKKAHLVLSDADRRKKFDETGDVDEAAIGTVESRAMGVISEIISMMLVADRDPCSMDLVSVMIDYLQQQIGRIDADVVALKSRLARAKKVSAKFKRKGKGDNLLERMTSAKATEIERGIDEFKKKREPFATALTIVREYDFVADVAPQTAYGYATGTSTWA